MTDEEKVKELIYKITDILIETGQHDYQKFALGEIIRYSPSEVMNILKKHSNELEKLLNCEEREKGECPWYAR